MSSIEDLLKKRGSGIGIVFVDNGTVDEHCLIYSDEHPEDLAVVKDALRKVAELAKFELIHKQEERERREANDKVYES